MIRQVTSDLVPVAVNLYKVRRAKDAGGDLFRSIQRQKDQYQGIWIVSPEGQKAIADYKIGGEQLFFPNAGASGV